MPSTNIIAIDPSTTCTGICVNNHVMCFVNEKTAKNKKDDFTKWFKIADTACEINTYQVDTSKKDSSFSNSETYKLKKYDNITTEILNNLKNKIILNDSVCLIEGYSYNSVAGNLIDLVTYSSLLRYKLYKENVSLIVVPPANLKMAAAKLTYPGIEVGKKKSKLEWRNTEGIVAGRFTKHEMYKSIIENDTLDDDWSRLLKQYASDQLNSKSISKPFDDINDSYILYHGYLSGFINK